MTIEEAKFLLQAYRPNSDVADIPSITEALAMLEEDAALKSWYEEEREFDELFASKLSDIEIPANLESEILKQVVSKPNKVVEFPWWKQFSFFGAAASILLALGLLLSPMGNDSTGQSTVLTVESFQTFANQALRNAKGFNAKSHEWATLVSYLDENNTPAPAQLPGRIKDMPPVGCMTLSLNDKPVGVVCFGKKSKSHLFVIESEDFPEMPVEIKPILDQNPYSTKAYWTNNDRHYLLLSSDPEELSQFVSF